MTQKIGLKEWIFFDRMLRIPWMDHEKLRKLRVSVIGLGNTGCPVAIMLYGLGLKEVWLIDRDEVELSNIQRQFMYTEKDLKKPKAIAAKEFLERRFKGLNTRIEAVVADVRYLYEFDFD